jgi:hypothetical protein
MMVLDIRQKQLGCLYIEEESDDVNENAVDDRGHLY